MGNNKELPSSPEEDKDNTSPEKDNEFVNIDSVEAEKSSGDTIEDERSQTREELEKEYLELKKDILANEQIVNTSDSRILAEVSEFSSEEPEGRNTEINPEIISYFQELGVEKTKELITNMNEGALRLVEKLIREGNLAYLVHIMQTAESPEEYKKMLLDQVDDDPEVRKRAGEEFIKFIGKGYGTTMRHRTEMSEEEKRIFKLLGLN